MGIPNQMFSLLILHQHTSGLERSQQHQGGLIFDAKEVSRLLRHFYRKRCKHFQPLLAKQKASLKLTYAIDHTLCNWSKQGRWLSCNVRSTNKKLTWIEFFYQRLGRVCLYVLEPRLFWILGRLCSSL